MSSSLSSSSSSTSSMPPTSTLIFSSFFSCFLAQQDRDLQSLHSASLQQNHPQSQTQSLVDQVMGHYEYYYRAKSALARRDVLPMFKPTWTSSTYNLFVWVGGWRPSTAFQLVYSKCGIQLEPHLVDFSSEFPAQDLGVLSHEQLQRIDGLQRETVGREREISEEEAQVQESVASSRILDLCHEVTVAMRAAPTNGGLVEAALESEMREKRERMCGVLACADNLRLGTLKRVVQVLNPMQSVHFLISASELLLRVHEFGKNTDNAARFRMINQTRSD